MPGFQPTEIYDIFTDSKGFLWIAHNGGISKYDGTTFTNFSNPEQSSLATTNILEDKYGRIWFVNFTGQIFYIENGHMNLLRAYKNNEERVFPRIGLLNGQLLATSQFGIFTCDVSTMNCRYEHCSGSPKKGTSSLSILNGRALLYGSGYWFIYSPVRGLKMAVLQGDDGLWTNNLTLSESSYRDTSLMFRSPSDVFYKVLVVGDTVKICGHKQFSDCINTIAIVKDKYWVNTINSSVCVNSPNEYIKGYNISCISVDKEGHYWYGSLQHGLLVDSVRSTLSQSNRLISTGKGDLIKCVVKNGGYLLLGTQNGTLISYNPVNNHSALLTTVPISHGGISYLKVLKNGNILIGTPVYTYILSVKNHNLKLVEVVTAVKQADEIDGALLFASSNSMIITSEKNDLLTLKALKKKFKGLSDNEYLTTGNRFKSLNLAKRSRAVCYSPPSQTIWVSVKDGLEKINSSGVTPFYLHNLPVYASCLTYYANKVIAGTFNDGVIIIEGDNNIKQLTSNDGLLSNNIVNVKVINNNLWVYTSGAVQIFDINTLKLIYKYPFPSVNNTFLIDADELDNSCYFASSDGLYKLSPVHKTIDSVKIYLNSLFINRKDTGVVNNLILPYSHNDIQIALGIPYLFDSKDIVLRYSLATGNDTRWIYARRGERSFHFASLAPGTYNFEAQAIKPQTGQSSNPFVINFTIRPPWWQTWWFRVAMVLALIAIIAAALRIYYLNKLRKQRIDYEKKLIVERERQHISREIHDNIGQALSVIKLNLDMSSPDEVNDTKELIGEVIKDLRQFTHGLYYGKLLTEGLIDVIKKDIERINNSKQLVASLNASITRTLENEQSELLIYRIFQESINNILKHAHAKNVIVKINNNKKLFKLSITDDGQGFSAENAGKGLGFDSMYKRAELLKGQLSINSRPGEGCEVELIIDHKQSVS